MAAAQPLAGGWLTGMFSSHMCCCFFGALHEPRCSKGCAGQLATQSMKLLVLALCSVLIAIAAAAAA
jgi:hypothetical protein